MICSLSKYSVLSLASILINLPQFDNIPFQLLVVVSMLDDGRELIVLNKSAPRLLLMSASYLPHYTPDVTPRNHDRATSIPHQSRDALMLMKQQPAVFKHMCWRPVGVCTRENWAAKVDHIGERKPSCGRVWSCWMSE